MVAPVRKVTAPKIVSDVVLWEEELAYSRETAAIVHANTAYDLGTPIAVDADGKTVPLPSDGSLVCTGVAISVFAAQVADYVGGLVFIKRTAILKSSGIIWPAGISDANKAKAIGELEAPRGVVVRAAV